MPPTDDALARIPGTGSLGSALGYIETDSERERNQEKGRSPREKMHLEAHYRPWVEKKSKEGQDSDRYTMASDP